jgi:hypothetical protein
MMQHVKVPIAIMQEIVGILVRMPYASVAALIPKIEALSIGDDAPDPMTSMTSKRG